MNDKFERLLKRWALVGAIGSFGLAANATAIVKPPANPAGELDSAPRIGEIAGRLGNIRSAVSDFVQEAARDKTDLAQWGNWGNWGNWNNWRDWLKPWYNFQNWGNW